MSAARHCRQCAAPDAAATGESTALRTVGNWQQFYPMTLEDAVAAATAAAARCRLGKAAFAVAYRRRRRAGRGVTRAGEYRGTRDTHSTRLPCREVARTVGQLRMFADVVEEGHPRGIMDHADRSAHSARIRGGCCSPVRPVAVSRQPYFLSLSVLSAPQLRLRRGLPGDYKSHSGHPRLAVPTGSGRRGT